MSAKAVQLAEAIVETLNEGSFSFSFTAQRRVAPVYDVSQLTGLEVSVFTGTRSAEQSTRASYRRSYKPVIAVQKKLPASDYASRLVEADNLQLLVEEIETTIEESGQLAGLDFITFDEEQDRDAYNIEAMQSLGVFTVAILLEYEG